MSQQKPAPHWLVEVQAPPGPTDPEVLAWHVPASHVPDAHSTFAQQAPVVTFCVHCDGPGKQVVLKLQNRAELQSVSVAHG